MQSVTITVNTQNAAFCSDEQHADPREQEARDEQAARAELASILRTLARHFEQGGPERARIYDRNGNAVGTVSILD